MSDKIRTAVIGVGYLGKFHAQKYKELSQSELVGVCDLNQDVSQSVADELGVASFSSPQELFDKVDAVTICTTTTSHFELVSEFVKKNIHVFVEKPMTASLEEASKVVNLQKEFPVKIQVGHIERFNPVFKKSKELMGSPFYLEFQRLAPFTQRGASVDVVLDVMIHDADLLLSLDSSEVKSIQAQGQSSITEGLDTVRANIEFESGLKASLVASRFAPEPIRQIKSYSKENTLFVDLAKFELNYVGKDKEIKKIEVEKSDAMLEEVSLFLESIHLDSQPAVSVDDGFRAQNLCEKIKEAL